MKILFVCRGNVGRSQIAEVIFNKYSKHKSSSAGTSILGNKSQKLRGLPLTKPVIEFMKKEGVDISERERKQLNQEMCNEFDKIIVMAEPETIPDYLKKNKKMIYWDIKDPKGRSNEEYIKIINQLKNLIREFIAENNL